MALSRPDSLGIEREAGWAPTDDTARRRGLDPAALFLGASRWTPFGLIALGHQVTVNIATGGLLVSATDLAMPYHGLRFQVARSFDAQEQHAQHTYLESQPNADPRVHLFANWQFGREATISTVWQDTFPELLVADGDGDSALYYRSYPVFGVNTRSRKDVEDSLHAYGVPRRTLAALDWAYSDFDAILRSTQGSFSILAGSYRAETMVDPAEVELVRFDVTTGIAQRHSSEFAYQQLIRVDGTRETTVQALVVETVDALGHRVSFHPIDPAPPYHSYRLGDASGRAFRLDLEDAVEYLDGNRPGGRVKAFVVSRASDETRPTQNTVEYLYDDGQLVEVRHPGHAGGPARVYRYAYDSRARLVGITDPVGDSFTIEYVEDLLDSDDRLVPRLKVSRLVDAEGNSAAYDYDHAHGTVTVTFARAGGDMRTIVYSYVEDAADTRQRYITAETIAVEAGYSGSQVVRTSWQYSADGRYRLEATADPLGGVARFAYNDFNQLTTQVDAAGHRRDFEYDAHDGPTVDDPNNYDLVAGSETNVDADGNAFPVETSATFQRYDAATSADPLDAAHSTHRVATRTNAVGATSSFDYDDAGSSFPLQPTRHTDPLGEVSLREYDATGALLRHTDPEGNSARWEYDAQGHLISSTDPNGFRRFWVYDGGTGWLTDATDALGALPGDPSHSIHYKWTAAGQPSQARDPTGATVDYLYYANKRVRSVTRHDPAAQTTSFAFDATGGLAEITDPRGHTTFFRSDEAGRVYATYRDAPANPSVAVRFDLAGHPIEATDRNGQATRYGYDAVGRVTSIDEPDWPAAAPANPGKKVSIDYDRLGRRLRVSDSELPHDQTYAYDAAGNLIETTDCFGSELVYSYDARSDLVRLSDGAGVADIRFERDQVGRVASVTDSAWRDPSRTFQLVHTQGPFVDNLYRIYGPSGLAARFSYGPNGQITEARHELTGTPIATYGYAYRDDGLLGQSTGDHVGEYDYDGMKRLTRETDAGVEDAYDGAGNRLWRDAQAPPSGQENVYDDDNRLVGTPSDGTTYLYDDSGNLVQRTISSGAQIQYSYDAANRLRLVESDTWKVAYLYDSAGRMLERRRTLGATTRIARYRYANGSILAALDGNDNVRVLYTRSDHGRLLRRRAASPIQSAPSSDPHTLFYTHDGLNSVVGLLDWDGNDHLAVSYDAWGEAESQGPANGDPFRYRGGFHDTDTGLLNFTRRWYDPRLGRWISQDPRLTDLLIAQGDLASAIPDIANLYVYVRDNPLNLADPTGLGPSDGGFMDWLRSTILGKVLEARVRAQGARPETGIKPTPTEQAKKNQPAEEEAEGAEPDPPEFEPGTGEGSRAPSSERSYSHEWGTSGAGGDGGARAAVVVGGAVVVVGVLTAPVTVPAAVGGAIVAGVGAGVTYLIELF